MVLTIGGWGDAPFVLKDIINIKNFTSLIETFPTVTLRIGKDLKEIQHTDKLFEVQLPQSKKNMNRDQQSLDIAGFIKIHKKLGNKKLKERNFWLLRTANQYYGALDWQT